jgi:flagellar protein FliJ
MKKFNFRLQRVIEVREVKKKQCQRDLALSQEELTRREQLLEQAAEESRSSCERLRHALAAPARARELTALDGWRHRQAQEGVVQEAQTEEQRLEGDQRRAALILAAKDKKALERLKEHALEEHRGETLREEQAFLDELGCRVGHSWKRKPSECEID